MRSANNNRLKQIRKTLKQRKLLHDSFQAKKLYELGLYDEASKLQKPTTEAIINASQSGIKGNEKLQNELESLKNVIESESKLIPAENNQPIFKSLVTPLDKVQNYDSKYVPQPTGDSRTVDENEYSIWKLGKHKYTFVEMNDVEYVHNLSLTNYTPIKLTEGLSEIFFNNGLDRHIITTDDIDTWERMLRESQTPVGYKNSAFYQRIIGKTTKSPRKSKKSHTIHKVTTDDHVPISSNDGPSQYNNNSSIGEGINSPTIIPSDPKELEKEFFLQMSAYEAGNKNTFNYVNALMKEMMRKKMINGKDYRKVLRYYYHI
jgi:hypothetical protein